jgi:putative membrane protein
VTLLFDEAGKSALIQAIKNIEGRSSVEVVIAVRRSSDAYRLADVALGVVVGLAALAFMLFSRFGFDTTALFIDPVIAGIVAALMSAYAPFIKHFFIRRSKLRAAVRCAASLAFLERGVHRTAGRSGVLVYLSLLEGMVELVLDTGVEAHLTELERASLRTSIERALPQKGVAVATALEALGELLEARMPRAEDDVNELPDEVH